MASCKKVEDLKARLYTLSCKIGTMTALYRLDSIHHQLKSIAAATEDTVDNQHEIMRELEYVVETSMRTESPSDAIIAFDEAYSRIPRSPRAATWLFDSEVGSSVSRYVLSKIVQYSNSSKKSQVPVHHIVSYLDDRVFGPRDYRDMSSRRVLGQRIGSKKTLS